MDDLSMSVGRDYRTSSAYEYVIYGGKRDRDGDQKIVARKGFFSTYSQAKRAGVKAAQALDNPPIVTEKTAQGLQVVLSGAERSAHQAAAARDAAGNGRIHARKPQQQPNGPLFTYTPRQPGLFDE